MALIVSVSGIRGVVGSELCAADALKLGMVFGRFAPDPGRPILTARDGRISGAALTSAVQAGLLAVGRNVVDLGIAATPTTCLAVRERGAGGAVIVSASHNPIEWNGLKLIGPDGLALALDDAARIRQAFFAEPPAHAGPTACGRLEHDKLAHQMHVQRVLDHCDPALVEEIKRRRFPVVLDSINGAGSIAGGRLLRGLGCRVTGLNAAPDGRFAHTPEPVPANLVAVGRMVKARKAMVGFVQDPDADRLALIDEHGDCIGEEYTLALAVWYMQGVRPGPVATNLSTSRMVDDIAARFGQRVVRTPVGEAHVARAVLAETCTLGGEGNGGVIYPDVVPVRDSLSGMALILQLLAKTGRSLAQLVEELPRYHMIKTKIACSAETARALAARLAAKFPGQPVNTADGVRVDFPSDKAWVHVRASNTEPIVRIIAEAASGREAEDLIAAVQALAG